MKWTPKYLIGECTVILFEPVTEETLGWVYDFETLPEQKEYSVHEKYSFKEYKRWMNQDYYEKEWLHILVVDGDMVGTLRHRWWPEPGALEMVMRFDAYVPAKIRIDAFKEIVGKIWQKDKGKYPLYVRVHKDDGKTRDFYVGNYFKQIDLDSQLEEYSVYQFDWEMIGAI